METLKSIRIDQSYEAIIQEVIKTKNVIFIPNIDSKGLLMIPLVSMGEVLGVIAVVNLEGKVTITMNLKFNWQNL